jgi:hypothetical protein
LNEQGQLVGRLRTALANGIANFKAYDVPAVCERLGLAPGTGDEAFNSKYRYAISRLQNLRADKVMDAARLYLEEVTDFDLSELVAKIDDFDRTHVSDLTRRRVVALFNGAVLSSELEQMEFIKRVWPVAELPSPLPGGQGQTLEDAVWQHTVNNDDWTQQELLQYLGVLTCSQRHFFRFLEEVTDPVVQNAERQAQLVTSINAHLQHDGFALELKRMMSGSPVYAVVQRSAGVPSDAAISAALQAFNPDTVLARWQSALERRANNT